MQVSGVYDSWIRRRHSGARRCLSAAILAGLLAGCSDRSADLQIRLTHLQDELNRTKAELEAARSGAAPAAPIASAPAADIISGAGGVVSPSTINANFDRGVAQIREELNAKFRDGRIERVSPSNPVYQADFAVEATIGSAPPRTERFQVQASPSGEWRFPSVEEVIERLRRAPAAAPATADPGLSAAPPPAAPARSVPSVMPANETREINWGDRPGARPATRPQAPPTAAAPLPPPAPPAARPGEGATPQKVMPADRDVRINF